MRTEESMNEEKYYFNAKELLIIAIFGIVGALTREYLPYYLMPEHEIPAFVHSMLHLPGPGAGILVFGGIICFWMLLAHTLIKKKGAAVFVSIFIIATDLFIGGYSSASWLLGPLILAIIIEIVMLFPVERPRSSYVAPATFGILTLICIVQILMGEEIWLKGGSVGVGIPIFLVLGVIFAVFCLKYPLSYITAGALGNAGYLAYLWIFAFPNFKGWVNPIYVPVLLLNAMIGGAIIGGLLSIGIYELVEIYRR
jgi:uncharacterized membrane protein YoaK (UPF0700 family)